MRLLEVPDWRRALVLGFAIGAGLLAKYAMAYFLPGLLLAAAFEKRARAPADAIGAVAGAGDGACSWCRRTSHGMRPTALSRSGMRAANVSAASRSEPSVLRPLEFLAAQFAVFGPVVFGVAIAACIGIVRRSSRRLLLPQDRILLAFALPALIAVTATAATLVHAYANWAAASFIPLAVLAAAILVRRNLVILLEEGPASRSGAVGADHAHRRRCVRDQRSPAVSRQTPIPYFRTHRLET